jgi:hypothetical protein
MPERRHIKLPVVKIRHLLRRRRNYNFFMETKDSSLNFICPICRAQVGEQCEMNNGYLRFESHLLRGYEEDADGDR